MFGANVRFTLPIFLGIVLVALVFATAGAEAGTADITVNGLYWGDGDHANYTFRSMAEPEGRGFLYINRLDAGTMYALVRVGHTVNDNVFHPARGSYTRGVGWNPAHGLGKLIDSDHLRIYLECGTDRWEWTQDLVYDADSGPGYDWRSDLHGPDGAAVTSSTGSAIPAGGIVVKSHSSTEYNLENSSWILGQSANSPNPNDWMALDLEPMGSISATVPITDFGAMSGVEEDYPFFRSTGEAPGDLFEWEISYEMELDVGHCNGALANVGVQSAHNSPAKDGSEDVEIPTAIKISSFSARPSDPYKLLLAAPAALGIASALVLVRRVGGSRRKAR